MDYIIPVIIGILGLYIYFLIGSASYKTRGFKFFVVFINGLASRPNHEIFKELGVGGFIDFMIDSMKYEQQQFKKNIRNVSLYLYFWPCNLFIDLLSILVVCVVIFLAGVITLCYYLIKQTCRFFVKKPYDWATNQKE